MIYRTECQVKQGFAVYRCIPGFKIFKRNGKGTALTPAGQQFVTYLSGMREDMKRAIEQGQNFSSRYTDNITVSMMVR
jgi:DNA-binding transcriptional LysR family regulator